MKEKTSDREEASCEQKQGKLCAFFCTVCTHSSCTLLAKSKSSSAFARFKAEQKKKKKLTIVFELGTEEN